MSVVGRWRYRAADADGRPVSGSLDAVSAEEAVDTLRQRALWVIDVHPEATDGAAGMGPATAPSSRDDVGGRVGTAWRERLAALGTGQARAELVVLTRAIATLLSAGVSLDRALAYAAAGEPNTRWAAVFGQVRAAVRGGQSLSEAVAAAPLLPPFFAPLLASAESAGTMAPTFTLLADQVERDHVLRQKVTSALVYPALLGVASTVGTAVILVVVVPRFAELIAESGGTLPYSTRALIAASSVLRRGGWLGVVLGVLAGAWWRQSLRDPDKRLAWHARRLQWPLTGPYEARRIAAAYLGTLSVALQAGVNLLTAMRLARGTVTNRAVASALAAAEARVRDGHPLSGSLEGTLPPLALRLLEAGESSGALPDLARRAAETAANEAERTLMRAVALIEPVMILGFGGVVALVALALLQAIYGLNASTL